MKGKNNLVQDRFIESSLKENYGRISLGTNTQRPDKAEKYTRILMGKKNDKNKNHLNGAWGIKMETDMKWLSWWTRISWKPNNIKFRCHKMRIQNQYCGHNFNKWKLVKSDRSDARPDLVTAFPTKEPQSHQKPLGSLNEPSGLTSKRASLWPQKGWMARQIVQPHPFPSTPIEPRGTQGGRWPVSSLNHWRATPRQGSPTPQPLSNHFHWCCARSTTQSTEENRWGKKMSKLAFG